MLPDQPLLVKCPHCSYLVWIEEQNQVGEVEHFGLLEECGGRFKEARSVSTPTFAEYTDFLAEDVRDKKKERYARLRTWWAGNDARRADGKVPPMSELEAANLRSLVTLLNEIDDTDRIMKAEAMRELGMFESAEALLSTLHDSGLKQAVEIICRLNKMRSVAVSEMIFK